MSDRELLKRVKMETSTRPVGLAAHKLQQQKERNKNKPRLP